MDMLSYFTDEMVTATLTPGSAGAYVNGEWVASFGTPSSIQIIQPQSLTQDLLNQLPQGERVQNFVQTWTELGADVRAGTMDGDRITFESKEYLVYQAEDRLFSGNFKRLILREITDDE